MPAKLAKGSERNAVDQVSRFRRLPVSPNSQLQPSIELVQEWRIMPVAA
jgi:hypothetical protein